MCCLQLPAPAEARLEHSSLGEIPFGICCGDISINPEAFFSMRFLLCEGSILAAGPRDGVGPITSGRIRRSDGKPSV